MPPSRLFVWVPLLLLSSCAQHRDIALLQAARQGDTQALQTLLSRGADPNQKDAGGLTALILSTRAGTVPAVETLLRHGADPNLRGGVKGWLLLLSSCAQHRDIALLQAPRQGYTQALQTLLSRGADPNQKDAGGLTALILSTRAGTVPARVD